MSFSLSTPWRGGVVRLEGQDAPSTISLLNLAQPAPPASATASTATKSSGCGSSRRTRLPVGVTKPSTAAWSMVRGAGRSGRVVADVDRLADHGGRLGEVDADLVRSPGLQLATTLVAAFAAAPPPDAGDRLARLGRRLAAGGAKMPQDRGTVPRVGHEQGFVDGRPRRRHGPARDSAEHAVLAELRLEIALGGDVAGEYTSPEVSLSSRCTARRVALRSFPFAASCGGPPRGSGRGGVPVVAPKGTVGCRPLADHHDVGVEVDDEMVERPIGLEPMRSPPARRRSSAAPDRWRHAVHLHAPPPRRAPLPCSRRWRGRSRGRRPRRVIPAMPGGDMEG